MRPAPLARRTAVTSSSARRRSLSLDTTPRNRTSTSSTTARTLVPTWASTRLMTASRSGRPDTLVSVASDSKRSKSMNSESDNLSHPPVSPPGRLQIEVAKTDDLREWSGPPISLQNLSEDVYGEIANLAAQLVFKPIERAEGNLDGFLAEPGGTHDL